MLNAKNIMTMEITLALSLQPLALVCPSAFSLQHSAYVSPAVNQLQSLLYAA
jgi:hypothetical protein